MQKKKKKEKCPAYYNRSIGDKHDYKHLQNNSTWTFPEFR